MYFKLIRSSPNSFSVQLLFYYLLIVLYEFKLIDNAGLDFIRRVITEGKGGILDVASHGEVGAILQYFTDAKMTIDSDLLNRIR